MPRNSGGAIASYSVSPDLPVGLSLDTVTGVVSGTPQATSDATDYIVTGAALDGSVQAILRITVADKPVPPIALNYTETSAVYDVREPIADNRPHPTGVVVRYTIDPALPAGLNFSTEQGTISGTPIEASDARDYTVTGFGLPNRMQSDAPTAIEHLTIAVQGNIVPPLPEPPVVPEPSEPPVVPPLPPPPVPPAPTGFHYQRAWAVYAKGRPIFANTAYHDGGVVETYAPAQPLPAGLTVDPATGDISGTPLATTGTDRTYTIEAIGPGGKASTQVTFRVVEPGTWTPVPGTMSTQRYAFAQLALPDGRVLVMGGRSASQSSLASAEIYDPNTGRFSPAGQMSAPRFSPLATLLPNGKVLVVGGRGANGPLASADTFDPAATDPDAAWQPAPPMSSPHAEGAIALTSDGNVVVTGGDISTSNSIVITNLTDVYSPSSGANGSWSQGPALGQATMFATALPMQDGDRIVVPAGTARTARGLAAVSIAQTLSNPWNAWSTDNMSNGARSQYAAWLVSPSTALVFGGMGPSRRPVDTVDLYDAAAQTWTSVPGLVAPRTNMMSAQLNGNSLLIAGGGVDTGTLGTDTAEIYTFDPANPANSSAATIKPMNSIRIGGAATTLADGTVLVVGGWDNVSSQQYWNTAELYVP
ncbi:putative Ig domain-containing protein [Trinickia sp. NRRL B-1857]|uniref:Kelch repeat-containing protein n=1 Tax=Trinickia sp. NRRL B-1857 TaxID=3162879 RepID=UPI003D2E2359